jgi:L-histidine Nalpha-methyltransferase
VPTAALIRQDDLLARFQDALAHGRDVVLRAPGNADPVKDFARSVVRGLERAPRRLDCRFLYDARGSALYERICELPEYYLTRTEASILSRCAPRIRDVTGPVTLFELGSGYSVKTDRLLAAYLARDPEVRYVPVDVSENALREAGRAIGSRRPEVQVAAVNGTYEDAFPLFRAASPVLVVFLGSTIGNLDEAESDIFLGRVAAHLDPGDFFLLGVDLVKEAARIEAAYNDAAGVTEAFTKNLFVRMNRELGAGLDVGSIEHVARYNARRRQIEIHARFESAQTLEVAPLGEAFRIAAGEEILVEISRKFLIGDLVPRLESFGFAVREIFTDPRRWFALILMERTRPTGKRTVSRGDT